MIYPFLWLALGLLLVFLEFFLPGIILGTIGGTLIVLSIIFFAAEVHSPLFVMLFAALAVGGVIGVIYAALRKIKSSQKSGLYSDADQEGYRSEKYDESVVGKEGVAISDLRPSGRIIVNRKTYQAMSQGGFIAKQSKIQVVGGEGPTLIVKSIE